METVAVIMAGGQGRRFWPVSRKNKPKQFLSLMGDNRSMLQNTVERLNGTVPEENIYVVTNACYKETVESQLPGINSDNIICEPVGRNTAPCIGLALNAIRKRFEDAVMIVLPSDHVVKNPKLFMDTLTELVEAARTANGLFTIGIRPNYPETGYGYIKFDKNENAIARKVEEFKEKPDYETAKAYVESGNYAWNSGMFVWKASTILEKFAELLPDIYACLTTIGDAMNTPDEDRVIQEVYPVIPKISIDYGILERSDDVLVLSGDFGWNDVGSWDMMKVIYDEDAEGNILVGDHVNIDTTNTISFSSGKMIATIGVDNLVVVETEDAILVCDKNRVQDVKKVVDTLNEQGRTDLL